MQIKNYPLKTTFSSTDKLLIQDGTDNAYKHILTSTLINNSSGSTNGAGLSGWKIKSENTIAIAGDRIIADMTSPWVLTFPANPQPGDEISVLPVNIKTNFLRISGISKFESIDTTGIGSNKNLTAISFIYINSTIGWVQNPRDIAYRTFPGTQLLYSSDGDSNGVFYYLGTNKNTQAWSNPYSARLGITASSVLAGQSPINSLVDRQGSYFHTNTETNPWIEFDLLGTNSLLLTGWSYQARNNDPQYIPGRLILSATNGTTYTQIDDKSFTTTQGKWVSFALSNQSNYYRKFRFTLPASSYFTAGEFEL